MFRSSDGLFHIVFANQDDIYISKSYLKMNFDTYLNSELRASGCKRIYRYNSDPTSPDGTFIMSAVNAVRTKEEPAEIRKNILFRNIFGGRSPEKSDMSFVDMCTEGAVKVDSEHNVIAFQELLDVLERYSDTAVIIPLSDFCRLTRPADRDEKSRSMPQPNIMPALRGLRKRRESTNNFIILTCSCRAEDNDPYFCDPDLSYPPVSGLEGTPRCILFNKELFPEIYSAFDLNCSDLPKLVLTYDTLASPECMGGRVRFWNMLTYDDILRIVKYHKLREPMKGKFYPAELIAAIIYVWYENEGFRRKYRDILRLPENVHRRNTVISELIACGAVTEKAIEHIIEEEQTDSGQVLLGKWTSDGSEIYVPYSLSRRSGHYSAGILKYLRRFGDMLDKYENNFSDEQIRTLSRITSFFMKPSYMSLLIRDYMTFTEFDETPGSELNIAFSYLENCREWNIWDNCSALIAFRMFEYCRTEAQQPPMVDSWNETGRLIFGICVKSMLYCREGSISNSTAYETAIAFYDRVMGCLDRCDKNELRNFVVAP